jgi:outer membrane receptor protein involved in Fe transport
VRAGGALVLCAALAGNASAQDATPTVTVTATRAPVVNQLDKSVVDVSRMPGAVNGSAQDVLQATPGLSVAADGSMAVKGNSRVTVLVDGKPMALLSGSSEERAVALQTMSGADIASIEVITNPSAAYNANGGAIVNIVLKRNRKPGAHGQIQGGVADHGLFNLGGSGDAGNAVVSVHGNVAVRHDGTGKVRESTVDWNNPLTGQSGQSRQSSTVFVHRVVDSAGLGLDYLVSDTATLSLSARHAERRSRPLFDVLNGTGETVYDRISEGPNTQSDDSASVSYTGQLQGGALKAMLQRSNTIGLVDKSYRDVFVVPASDTVFSHGATRSARHLDQATVDWTRGQWGAGVDLQDRVDDLRNDQATVDPVTGAETPDPATSNAYAVKTRLRAAYLTDKVRQGKWEALLGGRLERSTLQAGPAPAAHFQAFNPSVHLQYAASDATDLTLGYRRSLQLPDPRDLNPATTYVDAQNLSRGNPGLQPQRVSSWEIGANTEAAPWQLALAASYRTSRDTVTDARSFAGNVLVTSKQNGGQASSGGVTGSLDWAPAGKLRLGMDGGVYQVLLRTPVDAGMVRQEGMSGYVNARAAYTAGPDELSLDAHGQSAGITPLGRYGATSSVNLAWKRRLARGLSVTVNINDLFDGSRRTYATDAGTWCQGGADHFVARRITIGLVRKFE